MNGPRRRLGVLAASCLLASTIASSAWADVTWPPEQLLPSFSAPAPRQELIFLRTSATLQEDELPLFASLKGVVNRTQPRIFSYEGDAAAEGPHTWLESLGLSWTEHSDPWPLVAQFRSEIQGLVIYDPALPDTLNLATTIAGRARALVASPRLAERLSAAPYGLPVLRDLRGKFDSKLAVYESLLESEWPEGERRVLFGLSPQNHKASVREYAAALGAPVIWLDPRTPGESELLDGFLDTLGAGHPFMGWWPEEQSGVERASKHGIATVASDFATNLTLHGGMPRTFEPKPIPPKPRLENKRYVAFILSDGDNLQFVEHLMRKLWNDPSRGQVPIGWTVSPAMLDAMPGALAYYAESASPRDNLVSGPSGWGYAYPNDWPSADLLQTFAQRTDDYARRAGLRVVTMWNTITGGIDPSVGHTFAEHAPSLFGLTGQNTGGGLTVYADALPGFALSCNYCTGEQAMKDHIAKAAEGSDESAPRFILIQAQPWQGVTPTTFKNVQDSLDDSYRVVRPDHWFQLLRQAERLPIEPLRPVAAGTYHLINEASGKCLALVDATPGAAIEQRSCLDIDAQRWRVAPTAAGYAQLVSVVNEQLVLDLSATEEGAKTVLGPRGNSATQDWHPIWESGERYHLLSRASDQCLDVPNGKTDDVGLQQWGCNGTVAQAFRFASPTLEPPAGGGGGVGGITTAGAGGGGSGGATGGAGGFGGGAGGVAGSSSATPSDAAIVSGCACHVTPRRGGSSALLVGLVLLARRRRRRD